MKLWQIRLWPCLNTVYSGHNVGEHQIYSSLDFTHHRATSRVVGSQEDSWQSDTFRVMMSLTWLNIKMRILLAGGMFYQFTSASSSQSQCHVSCIPHFTLPTCQQRYGSLDEIMCDVTISICLQIYTEQMELEYTGCADRPGVCSNIQASSLVQHSVFSPGTVYKIGVHMTLPPSEKNLQLGMFMSCMRWLGYNVVSKIKCSLPSSIYRTSGLLTTEKCKSSVLEYKSKLLMLLDDLLFLPWNLLGFGANSQSVQQRIVYFG